MSALRRARLGRAREVLETVAALPWFLLTPLLRPWHLRWGATAEEAASVMPGDDVVTVAHFTATRAIGIEAPPDRVWPWIVQIGVGRAGFYSYDLIDNGGRLSADTILEAWQHPAVGDLAAPMTSKPTPSTSFRVHEVERDVHLVWAKPDSTWSWRLVPTPNGTRLITRLKQRYRRTPTGFATCLLMELGDFVMMRRTLRGIKARAERDARPAPP